MSRCQRGLWVVGLLLGAIFEVRSAHLYWSNVDGGDIRRAKLDGTEPQVLVTGESQPAIVTLDLSVPPPLNLQVAATSDAGPTLGWNALMGRAYQVHFKTDLSQTWSNLVPRLTATNTTMTVSDPGAIAPQRFYRALLLP